MNVQFRTIGSPAGGAGLTGPVAEYLTRAITRQIQAGKRVLWLVAGGSSIPIAVATSQRLVQAGLSLEKLIVSLTDERFGDVGHEASNWRQLEEAGFSLPGATLHPVLEGKDMQTTAADFADFLETELKAAQYRIGLFGVGSDGHTSGILPASSAVREKGLALGYNGGTYQRVTTTPAALARLDEAVVYAVGEAKWPVLDQLETDVSIDEQPAQALKQIPRVTVFTDRNKKEV